MPKAIRIALADDHNIVRDGLKALLENETFNEFYFTVLSTFPYSHMSVIPKEQEYTLFQHVYHYQHNFVTTNAVTTSIDWLGGNPYRGQRIQIRIADDFTTIVSSDYIYLSGGVSLTGDGRIITLMHDGTTYLDIPIWREVSRN